MDEEYEPSDPKFTPGDEASSRDILSHLVSFMTDLAFIEILGFLLLCLLPALFLLWIMSWAPGW